MLSFTKVDAQKKYVMHCMTRISQQECRGILENEWPISEEILFTGRIKKLLTYTTNIVIILNIQIITI